MRTLSSAALAAVNAVVTAPGHLVELGLDPTPARWSDIGQITLSDGRIFAAVDMRVQSLGFNGDAAPGQFTLVMGNLDSAIGALLLGSDLASTLLTIFGADRAAADVTDLVPLGEFNITQSTIGIDNASITCAPRYYTAPFRRVDRANGFKFATPAGTKITWGSELTIFDRHNNPQYFYNYGSGYGRLS